MFEVTPILTYVSGVQQYLEVTFENSFVYDFFVMGKQAHSYLATTSLTYSYVTPGTSFPSRMARIIAGSLGSM